ncbi:DUF3515 domain-containing protein [Gulosibacter bifidus]|uniref:DUF3515 domain-containing protein n=1 Tax=Gulosibacter bifidus TaxID=272239 RepID=A0ABW5RI22_9MICO|nr:DUF3515 domain-containing protein [Gulosibacter bifidus]
MQPAKDAPAPECAEVSVRLPETVAGLGTRHTNAQATGAWGNPSAVLLRCGVPSPPPTTDRCISINDVDWIEDPSEAPRYRYTTYGRTPAVEVVIDAESGVSGMTALTDLGEAVNYLPKTGACVGADDLLELEGATPAPTDSAAPTASGSAN